MTRGTPIYGNPANRHMFIAYHCLIDFLILMVYADPSAPVGYGKLMLVVMN